MAGQFADRVSIQLRCLSRKRKIRAITVFWSACLVAILMPGLHAAVVRVTIRGTVDKLDISDGPVFGFRSKEPLPSDLPFALTYTFDDQKGETTLELGDTGRLVGSGQHGLQSASPGVSAVLRVGNAVWEFGDSTTAEVTIRATDAESSLKIRYGTANRDNWVSSSITPDPAASWTLSGDWRQSFYADRLKSQPSPFSIDNGTVSARGTLIPSTLRVDGIDLRGQVLDARASGEQPPGWPAREWRLSIASPRGGYIVEQVTQTAIGSIASNSAPIAPLTITYWVAWSVAPGATMSTPPAENYVNAYPPGSTGKLTVKTSARFYEGLTLPQGFRAGAVKFAAAGLSSESDPDLDTEHATLPVTLITTFSF